MTNDWELNIELPNADNQNVINAFLLNLKNKKKSKYTVCNYQRYLVNFFKNKDERFSLITSDDIQQYFKDEAMKKTSLYSYKSALRSFYDYCIEEGYITKSPVDDKPDDVYWILKHPLPNIKNEKMINNYLLNLKTSGEQRRKVCSERSTLQLFFRDWEQSFSSITKDDIQQSFDRHSEWSKRTIESYLSILRSFYSFCWQEGLIENPPLMRKRWVRVAEKYWELQQPLSCEQNQKIINEFLLELKDNNRSKKMIEEIRIELQSFFLERQEPFYSMTSEDIRQWISEQKNNRQRSTILSHLSSVRTFYCFCIKQGYIKASPIPYLWRNKGPKQNYWELHTPLPNEENREMINEFLMSLKIMNASELTIQKYRSFLKYFFLKEKEPFYNLHPSSIQTWFLEHQKKWKESTFAYYLGVLSSFYKFCVNEDYIKNSPIKSRWFPRLPKPVPKYLEKEEIAKVRLQSGKDSLRNRAIVEFFLVSGCRLSEVYRLNQSDVDLDNRTARVFGKGQKIRMVHFTEKCALFLEKYLEARTDDNPALFVSKYDIRLGIGSLHTIIKKIGELAMLPDALHAHRFRHTFATELFAKGAELSFIGEEMGHKNQHTTQIYAQLPNQELITMYRKYMG